MPVSGDGFKAGVVINNIYLVKLNVTYEYDLSSWSTKKSMPTPRYDFAIATYQNTLFCIGGKIGATSSGINEVYDTASDSWESKAAMPTPRHSLDANVVNGKIYLIGGLVQNPMFPDVIGTYTPTSKNEAYDPQTDTWTTKTPIPTAADGYASAVVNGKIYIIFENITQIYDPETDTWDTGASPPYAVDKAAAATTADVTPQRIYVIGGSLDIIDPREVAYNQAYNPENDSWIIGTPMPTARYGLTVVAAGTKIYAIGGLIGYLYHAVETDKNEQYDPLKDKAIPSAPAPSPMPTQIKPTTEPQHEPFPILPVVVAAVTAVVAVGAGLLVYYKKRKR